MDEVSIRTEFYPLRLIAYQRSSVDLIFKISNRSSSVLWIEADVILPNTLSLSEDKQIPRARIRLGLVGSQGELVRPVKIYGNVNTYPDTYKIVYKVRGFDRYGMFKGEWEGHCYLRCERYR